MLAINRRLGFLPLPAWIGLKKTLQVLTPPEPFEVKTAGSAPP
jgi:hypothetical protein